jgi:hypothetical protein
MITTHYHLQKKSGEILQVCKELFHAASGISDRKTRTIIKKLYRQQLLLQGDPDFLQKKKGKNDEFDEKIREMLAERKEKLLSLEKGTYEQFVKVISGKKQEDPGPSRKRVNPKGMKKEKYRTKKTKIAEEISLKQEPLGFNQLDLIQMEICRICLKTGDSLLPIFGKLKTMGSSPAELINYSLPIKIDKSDNLPKFICFSCLDEVERTCKLIDNCLESQNVMENCLNEKNLYKIQTSSETLRDYVAENSPETESEIPGDPIFEDHFDAEQDLESQTNFPTPSSGMRPKKCYLCDCDFKTTPEDHFKEYHKLVEQAQCQKCEYETEFPWFMNLHYQVSFLLDIYSISIIIFSIQVHEDNYKICAHCGRRFESHESANYQAHKTRCSNPEPKPKKIYNCQYCSSVFQCGSSFKNHVRSRHTLEVAKY